MRFIPLLLAYLPAVLCGMTTFHPRDPSRTADIDLPIYNLFGNPNSYSIDTIEGQLYPISFDPKCTFSPKNNITNPENRTLIFLIYWSPSSRSECLTMDQALQSARTATKSPTALGLFVGDADEFIYATHSDTYGYKYGFYDIAGPMQYALTTTDGLATSPSIANSLISQMAAFDRMTLKVQLKREPGMWNDLVVSGSFLAFHWIMFAINVLALLIGLYRFYTIAKAKTSSGSGGVERHVHTALVINAIVLLLVATFSPYERNTNFLWSLVNFIYSFTQMASLALYLVWWAVVANRITMSARFNALRVFAFASFVLVGIYTIVYIALDAFFVSLVNDMSRVGLVTLTALIPSILLIIASIIFIGNGHTLLKLVNTQTILVSNADQFRTMTYVGRLLLVVFLLQVIAGFVIVYNPSIGGYYASIIIVYIAGWMSQLAILSIKGDSFAIQSK